MKTLLLLFLFLSISIVHSQSLRLIQPNGNNVYKFTDSIPIEWKNKYPDKLVRLEYSLDNGNTWYLIDTARGSMYLWKKVPKEFSQQCKIKVSQVESNGTNLFRTIVNEKDISISNIALSPDGNKLVFIDKNRRLKLWDIITGDTIFNVLNNSNYSGFLTNRFTKFTNDGKKVITVSNTGGWRVFNSENGQLLDNGGLQCGNENCIQEMSLHPTNNEIMALTMSDQHQVRIVNHVIEKDVTTLKKSPISYIDCGRYNKDGTKFGAGFRDGNLTIWDLDTRKVINTFYNFNYSSVNAVEFSPDGKNVAYSVSSSYLDSLIIRDIETGIIQKSINSSHGRFKDILYSNDGKNITTFTTFKVNLLNSSLETIHEYQINSQIRYIDFSKDASIIAVSLFDSVLLFDTPMLQEDSSDETFSIVEEITSIDNPKENNKILTVVQKENSTFLEINLNLSDNGVTTLKIFNSLGMLLDIKEVTSLGSQKISLKTDSYSSGTYHILLTTPTRTETASFIVVK